MVIFRFWEYFGHFLGLWGILVIDSSRKTSELDGTDFGEFEGLKEINKLSEETGVDRSQTL